MTFIWKTRITAGVVGNLVKVSWKTEKTSNSPDYKCTYFSSATRQLIRQLTIKLQVLNKHTRMFLKNVSHIDLPLATWDKLKISQFPMSTFPFPSCLQVKHSFQMNKEINVKSTMGMSRVFWWQAVSDRL